MGKRVLVTGIGSFWGGRVAEALEKRSDVDVIIGLGTDEPRVELKRTEFVRADSSYSILSRIVQATKVDTVVHTFLVVDSTRTSGRQLHETNVIGTMNLLAAAGAPGSSVRHIVVKSSALVYGSSYKDPAWFSETTPRVAPVKTRVERSLLEVEGYLRDFAVDSPQVAVTLMRFANVVGTDIVTPLSKALELPAVPAIFGFDPSLQLLEEDDVVRSIDFVVANEVAGVFNVAGDRRLPWSEVAALCGKSLFPLPPLFTGAAIAPLGRLGLVDLPPETLSLLRYGRGVDNRRLKAAGFVYRYTSAGAVENFAKGMRLRSSLGTRPEPYKYERDVESFFSHSPAVRRPT